MTETESRQRSRALVASFLFTDLVGYSKGTASDQFAAKSALSEILEGILPALRKDDYRIKDTGDGALIAFLSNPEHALYVALAMVTDFARASANGGFPSNSLRTGLHIGAVKEAIDLEARPNYVGDGINAAKRIMDFAAPGQITASRSYFEAVSWLDSAYGSMFHHLGASDDKHGRAHDLYEIVPDAAVLAKLRAEHAPMSPKGAPTVAELDASANITANDTKSPIPTASAKPTEPARMRHWAIALGVLAAGAVSLSIYLGMRSPAALAPAVANESASSPAREAPRVATQPALVTNGASSSTAPPGSDPAPSKQAAQSTAPGAPIGSSSNGAADGDTSASSPRGVTHDPETDAAPARPKVARPESVTTPAPARSASTAAVAPQHVTEPKRKQAESVVAPPATAPTGQSSTRCRSIVEKAAVGEPLSPDEKRELANSCR